MTLPFSYRTDIFSPILIITLSVHVAVLVAGELLAAAQPPQVVIVQALNTVEIVLVEEKIIPEIEPAEPVKVPEDVVALEPTPLPLPEVKQEPVPEEIVEEPIEESVEEVVEEEIVETPSQESKGVEMEAKPLEHINSAPQYPRMARQHRWEGFVVLNVLVDKDGFVSEVNIEKKSSYKILNESALRAIRNWRFAPAKIGQVAFSSWTTISVEFRLEEG